MGGSPSAKRESNEERNARILGARKSNRDARELSRQAAFLKAARRRSSLFGGPETGKAAPAATLGGPATSLGTAGV